MESLMKELTNFGALGVMSAILIYDVLFLQKKLISIIENNTKAMQSLKSYCSSRVNGDTKEIESS
jgi:hypothetical protein